MSWSTFRVRKIIICYSCNEQLNTLFESVKKSLSTVWYSNENELVKTRNDLEITQKYFVLTKILLRHYEKKYMHVHVYCESQ